MVGTLATIVLARHGFPVDLYEKRPDSRTTCERAHRTIAMSISERGLAALAHAELDDWARQVSQPTHSRRVHRTDGGVIDQAYGQCGESIRTIDRRLLNNRLLDRAASFPQVRLRFNSQVRLAGAACESVLVAGAQGGANATRRYEAILVADGVFSETRESLTRARRLVATVTTSAITYRDLLVSGTTQVMSLDPSYVHVWPRRGFLLVALAQSTGAVSATLFTSPEAPPALRGLRTSSELHVLCEQQVPDLYRSSPSIADRCLETRPFHLHSVECEPWSVDRRMLLMGDAAHGIVPFLAMGMNVGFEDCDVLSSVLDSHDGSLPDAIEAYTLARKPDADAISRLSQEHVGALDRSQSPKYHLEWLLDRALQTILPNCWIPAYEMIAFTRIPLREVEAQILRQRPILERAKEEMQALDFSQASQPSTYLPILRGILAPRLAGYRESVRAAASRSSHSAEWRAALSTRSSPDTPLQR